MVTWELQWAEETQGVLTSSKAEANKEWWPQCQGEILFFHDTKSVTYRPIRFIRTLQGHDRSPPQVGMHSQPEQHAQPELMDKPVVYHLVSSPLAAERRYAIRCPYGQFIRKLKVHDQALGLQ